MENEQIRLTPFNMNKMSKQCGVNKASYKTICAA